MSRIGRKPVELPAGVEFKLDGHSISVKGPNGALDFEHHPEMVVRIEEKEVIVERPSDQPRHRALHGLTRALIANMVEGVTSGFTRTLEIVGVGYRAEMKGKTLNLALGFSHPVEFDPPEGVSIECPNQTTIVIKGADKQAVGQAAAVIRGFRPPEPYKGKGVRYQGEQIRRKAGKTAGA
jgi:large subunit ribosomal protein L6